MLLYFPEQTLDVNSKLNCCTVILLDSFDQLKSTNKEGLLYGVPVSIKDNYGYKVKADRWFSNILMLQSIFPVQEFYLNLQLVS